MSDHQGSPNGCDNCGTRCEICHDRMCATYGPAPVVTCSAHPTCEDCDDGTNPCRDCATIRRATKAAEDAWNAAAQPQPWIDPVRDGAADSAAEARKEERAYALGRLEDREERAS